MTHLVSSWLNFRKLLTKFGALKKNKKSEMRFRCWCGLRWSALFVLARAFRRAKDFERQKWKKPRRMMWLAYKIPASLAPRHRQMLRMSNSEILNICIFYFDQQQVHLHPSIAIWYLKANGFVYIWTNNKWFSLEQNSEIYIFVV